MSAHVMQTFTEGSGGNPNIGKVGYNATRINLLMHEIASSYEMLGQSVIKNYEALKPVLRREWVGEDELDFEKKLVECISQKG